MRRGEKDLEWFLGTLGGKVPEGGDEATRSAAECVLTWLRSVSSVPRGVLTLRYTKRTWPTGVADGFGDLASVAVRLDCALHPAVGMSTEALEAASVVRLEKVVVLAVQAQDRLCTSDAIEGEERYTRLLLRASRHVRIALRAFARVRGAGPCVVPGKAAP